MVFRVFSRHKSLLSLALSIFVFGSASASLFAMGKPELTVLSPTEDQVLTSTDIPVTVAVANFKLSDAAVGRPDKAGEGHIHVMVDGMNMGVLFNFYTSNSFTLSGAGLTPGRHKLIFDLASNTHMDMADTAKEVTIDYQPLAPIPLPAPVAVTGPASVEVLSPVNNSTQKPQFTIVVKPTNFTPSFELEGKPNIAGYGHYHVVIDMPVMSGDSMATTGDSMAMSMAGMIGMPGTNSIPIDLSDWPAGKHTITIELVQNDHTPLPGSTPAMITVTIQK